MLPPAFGYTPAVIDAAQVVDDAVLLQVLIGSAMMVVTTVMHAVGMSLGVTSLTMLRAKESAMASMWARSLVVGTLVVIMFVTTLIEAGAWALTYVALGAISGLEESLYFSTVTYTTLGYGDVVLDSRWRLLSSFEAANGVIMFGWTTAVVVVAIRDVSKKLKQFSALE